MSTPKRRLSALVLPLLCLLWLGLWSLPAQAQETAFQLQQYRPLGDPYGMLHTQSGRNLGQWKYLVGVMLNYGNRPLTFRGPNSSDITPVMNHQFLEACAQRFELGDLAVVQASPFLERPGGSPHQHAHAAFLSAAVLLPPTPVCVCVSW